MRSTSNLVWAIWETACSAPPDEPRVSEFEESVLSVLRSLRWGEIHTYGEVAEMAGYPGRARGVGRILSITGEDVPWWRVVGPRWKARLTPCRRAGRSVTSRRNSAYVTASAARICSRCSLLWSGVWVKL